MILNKLVLGKYKGTLILLSAFILSMGSGWVGYKLSDALWLEKQAEVIAEYQEKVDRQAQRLSELRTEIEKSKRERKVVIREKIKYIKSGVPDCPALDDGRVQQLKCLAAPSTCR